MARCFPIPFISLVASLALISSSPAQATGEHKMTPEQQAAMEAYTKAATPGPQHSSLAKQVGNYSLLIKSWEAPGTEPMVENGTATRSMILGGRVMMESMNSKMMGQPFTGHGMRGFDNVTGKHWSTWNDSISTGLMTTTGSCDEKDACTFSGSWVDPVSKKTITSRMVSHWSGADAETFEMFGPGPDGKEFKMMEITYTRQK